MSPEGNSEGAKTYTKLCKKHGLHYDPALTSGCVRCRREMEVQQESSGAGFRAFVALAAVIVIALVAWFLSRSEPGEQPATAEPVETAAGPAQQTAPSPGESDPRLGGKTTAEGIIQSIRRLVARGRSETAQFTDVGVAPEELGEQWAQWSAEWTYRVDEITERVRRRPGGQADPALVLTYDELETAVEELRQIVNVGDPGGVSFASDCDIRFGTAEQALDVAQSHLDGLTADK
ncbi:MAG: hypothetical protein GY856_31805 [bacterium]|nr:hypothetical protein [bacterium]